MILIEIFYSFMKISEIWCVINEKYLLPFSTYSFLPSSCSIGFFLLLLLLPPLPHRWLQNFFISKTINSILYSYALHLETPEKRYPEKKKKKNYSLIDCTFILLLEMLISMILQLLLIIEDINHKINNLCQQNLYIFHYIAFFNKLVLILH